VTIWIQAEVEFFPGGVVVVAMTGTGSVVSESKGFESSEARVGKEICSAVENPGRETGGARRGVEAGGFVFGLPVDGFGRTGSAERGIGVGDYGGILAVIVRKDADGSLWSAFGAESNAAGINARSHKERIARLEFFDCTVQGTEGTGGIETVIRVVATGGIDMECPEDFRRSRANGT
jgi:hypothetical protein